MPLRIYGRPEARLTGLLAVVCFGAPSLGAQVFQAADYSTGIPAGAVFSVFGEQLAPSVAVASPPLPLVWNQVSVRVSCGSGVYDAPLLYVSPSQINAVFPSEVPEGTCTLTASNGDRRASIFRVRIWSSRTTTSATTVI